MSRWLLLMAWYSVYCLWNRSSNCHGFKSLSLEGIGSHRMVKSILALWDMDFTM